MKKTMITLLCGFSAAVALIASAAGETPPPPANPGRDAFLRNQAYAEMQRVSGQMDVLQSNLEALERRVGNMEGDKGEIGGLKRDLEALRRDLASVRREMAGMRAEITEDLTKKIQAIMKTVRTSAPPAGPAPAAQPANCKKYKVEPGDSLFLIAQAFNTSVARIKELNNLKSDNLRVGQELLIPAPRR